MLKDLLPLASYCFVMSSTPGPNNPMLTPSGANFGYRGTLPHIAGINAGGALQTFLCCLGLGALFEAWPALQHGLRLAGAAYLMWLAWRLARTDVVRARGPARPLSFWQGAAFQAVNPKSWLKALTLGSVFMPPGLAPLPAAALVSTVGLAVGFPCVSAWAMFGAAIRHWLADARHRRRFNVIMAAALAVLALELLQR